jgi:phosphate butyryltransferase
MISNLSLLLEEATRKNTKVLAIAAAEDKYVMNAILKAKELGLIKPIYIGNQDKIQSIATSLDISITSNEIIHCPDSTEACIKAVKWFLKVKPICS